MLTLPVSSGVLAEVERRKKIMDALSPKHREAIILAREVIMRAQLLYTEQAAPHGTDSLGQMKIWDHLAERYAVQAKLFCDYFQRPRWQLAFLMDCVDRFCLEHGIPLAHPCKPVVMDGIRTVKKVNFAEMDKDIMRYYNPNTSSQTATAGTNRDGEARDWEPQ